MGKRGFYAVMLVGASMGLGVIAVLSSCVSDTGSLVVSSGDAGGAGEPCYGNGSCDEGLICLSNTCVSLDGGQTPEDSGSAADASRDSGAVSDGALGDGSNDGADADDSSSGIDAAANCGSAPVLPSTSEPGPMCPFLDAGDGGVITAPCGASARCCEYSAVYDSFCQSASCPAQGSASTIEWPCDHNSHCGGKVCCLVGVDGGTAQVNYDPLCLDYFGTKVGGTQCLTTCGSGGIPLCAQDSDCAPGKCVPFKTKGKTLGVCSTLVDGG